jgi:glycosyltransferase involved in cell wall biosynthesis
VGTQNQKLVGMRILLTTHVFLPDFSSGTEVLTFNTARELQRLGHEVEICTGFPTSEYLVESHRFDTYEYEGLLVNRYRHNSALEVLDTNPVEIEFNNQIFARWFRTYLERVRPQIVHFFHLDLISASAIQVCHELSTPMVMTPTDFWLICPNKQLRLPNQSMCFGPDRNSTNCIKHAVFNIQPKPVAEAFNLIPVSVVSSMAWAINKGAFARAWFSPFVRSLTKRAGFLREQMNHLNRVLAPTKLMGELLIRNGLEPKRLRMSRYGIRQTHKVEFQPSTTGALRIGFIGGLSEHKGAHLLVQAVLLLPGTAKIEVKIFGRTDLYPEYLQRLHRIIDGDPRISLCGTFPNEEIGSIFANLDVLVVPSIWYENTPLVMYSAQAAGCPVIASNLGGMSEIVQDNVNGLLFQVGDVNALSASIARIANDRDLLKRLASGAIEPKSSAEYALEILGVYGEVLTERSESEVISPRK